MQNARLSSTSTMPSIPMIRCTMLLARAVTFRAKPLRRDSVLKQGALPHPMFRVWQKVLTIVTRYATSQATHRRKSIGITKRSRKPSLSTRQKSLTRIIARSTKARHSSPIVMPNTSNSPKTPKQTEINCKLWLMRLRRRQGTKSRLITELTVLAELNSTEKVGVHI